MKKSSVFLTLCYKCQIDGENLVNFFGLLRKHEFPPPEIKYNPGNTPAIGLKISGIYWSRPELESLKFI